MQNPGLGQHDFASLDEPITSAFLDLRDATSDIQSTYRSAGLVDSGGTQRVVQPVVIPAGSRLFKLTATELTVNGGPHPGHPPPTISSWWSTAEAFHESAMTAGAVFRAAVLNHVTMRDYVRFASAVTLEWNPLTYYCEITTTDDIGAFWGQFAAEPDLDGAPLPKGMRVTTVETPSGPEEMVIYAGSDEEVYLPARLGGTGAWQLFVPNFSTSWIAPRRIVNLSSTDNDVLAKHFGVTPDQLAELRREGGPLYS